MWKYAVYITFILHLICFKCIFRSIWTYFKLNRFLNELFEFFHLQLPLHNFSCSSCMYMVTVTPSLADLLQKINKVLRFESVQGIFETTQKILQSSPRWRITFMRSTLSCNIKITINDFYFFILYHILYVNFMQHCMIYIDYYMPIFISHPTFILVRGLCISAREPFIYKKTCIKETNKKLCDEW